MTAERWRDLVGQQQRSGLSIEAFCAMHGLATSTFFVWRRRLELPDAPTFVELTPASVPPVPPAPPALLAPSALPAPPALPAPSALPAGAASPPVLSVSTDEDKRDASRSPIELQLRCGLVVRVREGFDAPTLRQVVEALR